METILILLITLIVLGYRSLKKNRHKIIRGGKRAFLKVISIILATFLVLSILMTEFLEYMLKRIGEKEQKLKTLDKYDL